MSVNAQRPRPPPNRRRDKVQLSCDPCRHRKLRCDRQDPCGTCSRRGLTRSCNYATTSSFTGVQGSVAPRQSTSLHGRVSELESLVVTLMKGQSLPSPQVLKSPRSSLLPLADVSSEIQTRNKSQDEAAPPADPGTLKLRESGTSYVQSVHWEAILTKIRGLKEDLTKYWLLFPLVQLLTVLWPFTLIPILSLRVSTPKLLSALRDIDRAVCLVLIHRKKFLREYEAFWEDPSATTIAWIGLMFSMLYIAALLQTFTIDFNDGRAKSSKVEYFTMKDDFREKAVQCLALSRYTTGGPYILETLITVLTGESVLLKDSATDGWLSINTILHLAIRMGYHRDPDHFPGISPFEGELRRRIWTTILVLDIALSLEMGLPRSATNTQIDTKLPRNVRDCDFEEDTVQMPPPRPETEWTPVLPLIAKGRLISALGRICDINSYIDPPSHHEVIRADAGLEDVHSHAIPAVLRWETMPHPITDSPNLVIQRVSIETAYHKSRILLYRRALISYPVRQPQEQHRESVQICLDAALKILSFQQMLHEESQPFGRLSQLRWKVTHIFNQDVLLATSVLCLFLQDIDKFALLQTAGQTTSSPRAEEIRQRLTMSHEIWLQMSTASTEAGKVAKALSIVLGSAEDSSGPASYDFLADFDAGHLNEFGAMFNNEYLPSGLYSPLTFFDDVLENRGP